MRQNTTGPIETYRSPGRLGAGLATAAAAVMILAGGASGQVPALSGFEPVGYVFEMGGDALPGAEVYHSRGAGAFLVLDSNLQAPVLVRLREGRVETVNLMKVNKRPDGTVDLLPDASLEGLGGFKLTPDQAGITFQLDGRAAVLKEKPPLLGRQDLEGMRSYSPEYVRTAAAYSPSGPIVEKLRQESRNVRVAVYFGSWCPFCQQMVPRLMKVAEQLDGSGIQVDFYGLPRAMSSDPEAARMDISGVPTAVVFVDGSEVGRIQGNSWRVPELAINNLLSKT